jgi:hypothetical protein
MTAALPTCPYCNAAVPVPAGTRAGQRVPCPRCGESFTLLAAQAADAGIQVEGPSAVTAMPPHADPGALPGLTRKPRNWVIAAAVLGVMAIMATVGLTFALYTQAERRANDLGLKQPPRRHLLPFDRPDTDTTAPVRPDQFAALGYLPPDTNVILAIHVAELLRDEAGRQLLNTPVTIARQELRPGQLADWCGLPRDEIDHLVLGLATEDPVLPRVNLVVRTRHPYQADRVRAALKAERAPEGGKKELYQFALPNLSFKPVVWFLDDRTLALGLIPSHLEAVPAEPRAGLAQLAPELRELLKERVEQAPVWAAGLVEEQARGLVGSLFPRLPRKEQERWTNLRSFAAWAQLQKQVRVGAALHCRDEQAAEGLAKSLTAPGPEGESPVKAFPDGSWVTLQWKGDLDSFLKDLAR